MRAISGDPSRRRSSKARMRQTASAVEPMRSPPCRMQPTVENVCSMLFDAFAYAPVVVVAGPSPSAQPSSAPLQPSVAVAVHRRRGNHVLVQAAATAYPTVSMFPTRYFSHYPTGPTKPPVSRSPTLFSAANRVTSEKPTTISRTRFASLGGIISHHFHRRPHTYMPFQPHTR